MAQITLKMDVKAQDKPVPLNDIKVDFGGLVFVDQFVVEKRAQSVKYTPRYPQHVPFMLLIVPIIDPTAPLRNNDLLISVSTKMEEGCSSNPAYEWFKNPVLFFNNTITNLSQDITGISFRNNTDQDIKLQIIVGFDPTRQLPDPSTTSAAQRSTTTRTT